MTTDTEIKTGIEVHLDDGDLVVAVIDGYGKLSILRYPIPQGGEEIVFDTYGPEIGNSQRIKVRLVDWGSFLHVGGITLTINKDLAVEIAEIMHGGPLPDAPHNCSVAGCDHGHAA